MFDWAVRLLSRGRGPRPRRVLLPKRLIPEGARAVLESADTMTVYSLDPDLDTLGADTPENFHRFRIFGSVAVGCPALRSRIAHDFIAANLASQGGPKCFDPNYGVRAASRRQVVDLLACFACSQLEVIGPDGVWGGIVPVTGRPERRLRRLLREAGIRVVEPRL